MQMLVHENTTELISWPRSLGKKSFPSSILHSLSVHSVSVSATHCYILAVTARRTLCFWGQIHDALCQAVILLNATMCPDENGAISDHLGILILCVSITNKGLMNVRKFDISHENLPFMEVKFLWRNTLLPSVLFLSLILLLFL